MKTIHIVGLALGASIGHADCGLRARHYRRRRRPDDGRRSHVRPPDEERRRQAVADINAAGGVLGKKLKLEVGDDACDPKQARSVGREIRRHEGAGSSPDIICSSSSIPASEAYAEGGVLQITPASTNPPSPSASCGTRSASAAVTTSRARSPAQYIAKNFQGQERRDHQRQDHLRQRPRRRDQEGAEQGGHEGQDVRVLQQGRQGLHRPRLHAQARQHRSRVCRRLPPGSRPDPAPDARSGHEDRADGGRRAGRQGVRLDHRRRPPKACCSPSAPIRATSRPPRRSSKSSRRRTSIRKATRSTPMPRSRSGRRRPQGQHHRPKKVAEAIKAGELGHRARQDLLHPKGDITVIDYVVYKWDAKGNYAELNKGS